MILKTSMLFRQFLFFIVLIFTSGLMYCQNSEVVSFNASLGLYQPVKYLHQSVDSPSIYEDFFDQHCINSKMGFSYKWRWKWLSFNLGLNYSRSYNNYAYEDRYVSDNLYGKFRIREKYTAITVDPALEIKIAQSDVFRIDGIIGVEVANLFNYIQTERSKSIGTITDDNYDEINSSVNKNRIVVYSYFPLPRPFAGLSAAFNINEKFIFEVRPLVMQPLIKKKSDYTLDFKPYSGGEYRNAKLNYSMVLSLGYRL